jgi:hypothetical protein
VEDSIVNLKSYTSGVTNSDEFADTAANWTVADSWLNIETATNIVISRISFVNSVGKITARSKNGVSISHDLLADSGGLLL